jgi:hypothetical protein
MIGEGKSSLDKSAGYNSFCQAVKAKEKKPIVVLRL